MAGSWSIILYEGAAWRRVFEYTDANDDPIDMTDYTVEIAIGDQNDDDDPIILLTSPTEITIDEPNGQFTVVMPDDVCDGLGGKTFTAQMDFIDADGVRERMAVGPAYIRRSVDAP